MSAREGRRLALQSTAEIWRGLDVLDSELRACQLGRARDTVKSLRAVVKLADELWVQALRDQGSVDTADVEARRTAECKAPA